VNPPGPIALIQCGILGNVTTTGKIHNNMPQDCRKTWDFLKYRGIRERAAQWRALEFVDKTLVIFQKYIRLLFTRLLAPTPLPIPKYTRSIVGQTQIVCRGKHNALPRTVQRAARVRHPLEDLGQVPARNQKKKVRLLPWTMVVIFKLDLREVRLD
jgi:hypothetical protein